MRVAALDADIEDAIDEGIIFVGAAGNGRWKHDVPGGTDWNNTFEMGTRYPGSVSSPYYYMRGTSPTANDNTSSGTYDIPNICVGAVDSIQIDQKVLFSDCGPGVDIWAPGTAIISALPGYASSTPDPRSGSHYIGKYNGNTISWEAENKKDHYQYFVNYNIALLSKLYYLHTTRSIHTNACYPF